MELVSYGFVVKNFKLNSKMINQSIISNKPSITIENKGLYNIIDIIIDNKKTIFNKCQPSVNQTKNVDDPKNFSPWFLSPFFHLFFHEIEGFQKF